MKYIKVVACPICNKMNEVPDNLEDLVDTVAYRSKDTPDRIKVVNIYLRDLEQDIIDRVIHLLELKEQFDPNDWLDIECVFRKKPYGRHTFRYNLKTGDVLK